MAPGDFKAQCLSIKESGANYAYVGNLGGSVVSLLSSCGTVGTDVTYMANIWGGDYKTVEAANAQDYVFPTASPFWGADAPGMALVEDIYNTGTMDKSERPTHHYIRGICSAHYMIEAMKWAKANGGLTGENIRDGMYQKADWVPEGLEGVCMPSNWTNTDHRGTTVVTINKGSSVDGKAEIEKIGEVQLPRRDDWIGY
jgi:branched-chain amino acid transport system substrate-binding protein